MAGAGAAVDPCDAVGCIWEYGGAGRALGVMLELEARGTRELVYSESFAVLPSADVAYSW